VIRRRAAELQAPVVFAPEEYRWEVRETDLVGQTVDLEGPGVATRRFALRCLAGTKWRMRSWRWPLRRRRRSKGLRWIRRRSVAGWRKSSGPGVCRC